VFRLALTAAEKEPCTCHIRGHMGWGARYPLQFLVLDFEVVKNLNDNLAGKLC
jgi:hypothetical protein